MLLHELGISNLAHVVEVGAVKTRRRNWRRGVRLPRYVKKAETSALLCLAPAREELMLAAIAGAAEAGDTLGGMFEIVVAPASESTARRQAGRAHYECAGSEGGCVGAGF